jgi:threonine/homoserine/homoserine lactone efflux protein
MLVDLASLLIVLTLGVLSPGPDFLLVLKNSVGGTRGTAFATVGGIAAGLFAQLTVIAVGFTAMTPEIFRVVQLGGAAFLSWIGVRALLTARSPHAPTPSAARSGATVARAFVEGLGCNLTNPKAFLFYVGMFAHVLHPGAAVEWRVILPLVFVVHAAIVWSVVVLALQSPPIARRLTFAQRWLPRAFGIALVLLAIWIACDAW